MSGTEAVWVLLGTCVLCIVAIIAVTYFMRK